jgi:hypothetical protein
LVFVWFCLTIPARIESDVWMSRRDIDVVQERVSMVAVMRATANDCRIAAQKARADVISAKDSDVDAIYAQAIKAVTRIEEMLSNYGQRPATRWGHTSDLRPRQRLLLRCLAEAEFAVRGRPLLRGRVHRQACFQIARNDARTLMLYTGRPMDAPSDAVVIGLPENLKRVWFALR